MTAMTEEKYRAKLEHLRKMEKRTVTRIKRAATHLKKIQRSIRYYERALLTTKETRESVSSADLIAKALKGLKEAKGE